MLSSLLIKGCLIGFSIAMPVGPIGLLCIRNSLGRGLVFGLMTGLGAALADAIFGAIGGFGVSAIGTFFTDYRLAIELAGAIFLCYLGLATFAEKTAASKEVETQKGYFQAFASSFLLTLTNPLTILSFAGVYAGLGAGSSVSDLTTPIFITLGVFLGSALWWLLLSTSCSCFKDKMNGTAKKWLNRISGGIILGFGLLILINAVRAYFSA